MKCYVCDSEISSANETEEHIIINAAGGRLKSKELLCKKCNSDFGEKIDSELAKQVNSIANMLMIKRHRGEPQPIVGDRPSTGEQYDLEVGGTPRLRKPTIDKTTDGNNTNIAITARSESELRKILKGIAKNNPHFDVEEAMKTAQWKKEYLDEALHFQNTVGGKEVFRAICKCATNFYVYKKGDATFIKDLIPYIKGEKEADIVWMHYQEDVYELSSEESFHLIHLVGNSTEKILYCYVDYFNTYKYLVFLCDNYNGNDLAETYCSDLINVKEINKDINLDYNRNTLFSFFANKDATPFEKVKKSFDHSIALGLKRQDDFQRRQILERAIQSSLGKHPDGITITEEMINEAIEEIVKSITPYITRRLKK